MREWIGDRVINDMKEFSYEIENKLYESTLGIKRTDIEDDSLGQYRTLAQSEGQEVADFFWRERRGRIKIYLTARDAFPSAARLQTANVR